MISFHVLEPGQANISRPMNTSVCCLMATVGHLMSKSQLELGETATIIIKLLGLVHSSLERWRRVDYWELTATINIIIIIIIT